MTFAARPSLMTDVQNFIASISEGGPSVIVCDDNRGARVRISPCGVTVTLGSVVGDQVVPQAPVVFADNAEQAADVVAGWLI